MKICQNCGGAIFPPNIAVGYAGPICYCPVHPDRMYQKPGLGSVGNYVNPLDQTLILQLLDEIKQILLEMKNGKV